MTTFELLWETHEQLVEYGVPETTVTDIGAGTHIVGVELTTAIGRRLIGLAPLPDDDISDIQGRSAKDVIRIGVDSDPSTAYRAVCVAALNALSSDHLEWQDGDPISWLEDDMETIEMAGLFRPAVVGSKTYPCASLNGHRPRLRFRHTHLT